MRWIVVFQQMSAHLHRTIYLDVQFVECKPEHSISQYLSEVCMTHKIAYSERQAAFSLGEDDVEFIGSKQLAILTCQDVEDCAPFSLYKFIFKGPFILFGAPHFESQLKAKQAAELFLAKQQRWLESSGMIDDAFIPVGEMYFADGK